MATPDELRGEIEAARSAFRAALERSDPGWEQRPQGDEWTRREVAEHAIRADYSFAGWAVTIAGGTPGERPELTLGNAGEALQAFAAGSAIADPAWAKVQTEDLGREVRPEWTVEAAMELVARHLREHAEQIGVA